MTTLLTIVHVLVCLFLIAVVLLQSGRAGGMGVLSGAATQTVFGGRGAGGFLQKTTAIAAIVFMITCASLSWIASSTRDRGLRSATGASTATTAAGRAPARAQSPASTSTFGGTPAPSTVAPAAVPAVPAPAPTPAAPPAN